MITTKGMSKSLMAILTLGSVLSMLPAAAAWAGMFDGAVFTVQNGGYEGGRGNRGARETRRPREARVARPAPEPQAPRERSRGQMSEEDRQQLHRDLDRANRELYRSRRR